MILANDLVEKFQYALDNKWGYIWGTAGVLWTEAKQKQLVQKMITKYGTSWKENSEAKLDNYYRGAVSGGKWVGHYVADCSGLFAWAFKQLGGSIAHGSNSIWKNYCVEKGQLSDKTFLAPGYAVFTDKVGDKTHVGQYIGNGDVIEASSTVKGVISSKITDSKWKCWGKLKGVAYDSTSETERPTLRLGDKGEYVTLLQVKLREHGYSLGPDGVDGIFGKRTAEAVKQFQLDWGLTADGIVGPKTWQALETTPVLSLMTVHIPHLSKYKAEELLKEYKDAWMTEDANA